MGRQSDGFLEDSDRSDARVRAVERLLFQSQLQERISGAPLTRPVTPSLLLKRLQTFLPEIQAANDLLVSKQHQGEQVTIDSEVVAAPVADISSEEPAVQVLLLATSPERATGPDAEQSAQPADAFMSGERLDDAAFPVQIDKPQPEPLKRSRISRLEGNPRRHHALIEEISASAAPQRGITSAARSVSPSKGTLK